MIGTSQYWLYQTGFFHLQYIFKMYGAEDVAQG